MKIKTSLNREVRGNETTPDKKKRTRRKPASNQKPRLSVIKRIASVFRFMGKVLAPALLSGFVILSGILSLRSDAFHLRDIIITGCRNQDAALLEDIIRKEFPENVLHIDLGKTRQRLEKETWVKYAEVHRVLPASLVLRIQERAPVVLLELGGEQITADSDGVLLGPYRRGSGKIDSPVFRGLVGNNPETYTEHYAENSGRVRRGIAMLTEIASEMPENIRDISEIDVSELNNIKIMMDNDSVEICMGNENYLNRFSRFVRNYSRQYQELKNQGVQVAQVDLSNDDHIVFKSHEAVAAEKAMKSKRSVNR